MHCKYFGKKQYERFFIPLKAVVAIWQQEFKATPREIR
ncbi:hypothetical protein T12_1476 [Trichinella patagoniensis]|uniref:Uncharacterized protein n=1 Tax=Trichinella patagoniensis TaxID=990121 RepID=A0A0V0XUP2_9BILA|nr:hypothetical protein T12_1476 [Trichinella patagoniensis]